jgi:NAD/NADP transhydrogenase beta subunit
MFQILSIVAGIGSLICFVMVLIPLFREKGALHGILGIICGLYTFIWGWMNVTRLNIRNVMLAWSACMLVGMGCNMVVGMQMAKTIQSGEMPAGLPAPTP